MLQKNIFIVLFKAPSLYSYRKINMRTEMSYVSDFLDEENASQSAFDLQHNQVKNPWKLNPLPALDRESAEQMMNALDDVGDSKELLFTDIGVCGNLVGVAMEAFGLESPSIGEFREKLSEYLSVIRTE